MPDAGSEGKREPCPVEKGHDASVSLERVRILLDRSEPLVPQIVDQIVFFLIGHAGISPGDRLPSRDDAARRFGVADKTMGDAYRVLQQHGIIRSTPGSGTYFTGNADRAASRYLLTRSVNSVISQARVRGILDEEIVGVVLAALARERAEKPEG